MKRILFIVAILSTTFRVYSQFGNQVNITNRNQIGATNVLRTDIDNDGLLDMIVLSSSFSVYELSWYKNNGNETFGGKQVILTDSEFLSVILCDIDSDTDSDLLISRRNIDKLSWIENTQTGVFGSEIVIDDFAYGTDKSISIDIDNDGDEDIITVWTTLTGEIVLYENLGNNLFNTPVSIDNPADGMIDVKVADINNDGYLDFYTAKRNPSGTINNFSWYQNLGNGSFGNEIIIYTAYFSVCNVQVFDVDLDGDLDFITSHLVGFDIYVNWFENLGGGLFGPAQLIFSDINNTSSYAITYGDVDGDTDWDIVISLDEEMSWMENLGSGNFGAIQHIVTYSNTYPNYFTKFISMVDVNDDGKLDIINTMNTQFYWQKNLGGGTFYVNKLISTNTVNPTSFCFDDVDNDNDLDILVSSSLDNKISWFKNDGFGNYIEQIEISTNTEDASFLRIKDIDYDGDFDIIASSSSSTRLFEKTASNNFLPYVSLDNGGNTKYNAFSDFNGDGIDDLLVITQDNRIKWYPALSVGIFDFWNPQTFNGSTGNYFDHAIIFDSDNDGDDDVFILKALNGPKNLLFHENLGSGNFGASIEIGSDFYIEDIVEYDIDNDGDKDILCAGLYLSYFENLGGNNFAAKVNISYNRYKDIHIADIDMDNKVDIIGISSVNNEVAWHKGLGNFSFGPKQVISNQIDNGVMVNAGDVDVDGDLDIVTISSNDNKVALYKNYILNQAEVSGTTYYDVNQNNIFDSLDFPLNFVMVNSSPSSDFTFSESNGTYSKLFSDSIGTYTIQPETPANWALTSDSLNYTIHIDSNVAIFTDMDFGFNPDSIFNEVDIDLTGAFPSCNSNINYWINLQNIGTTLVSGVIALEIDPDVTFESSSVAPDSINGQLIYWHLDSLFFNEFEMINLTLNLPPFTSMGDTLQNITSFFVEDNGFYSYLNSDTLHQVLVCAYDPNDKIVSPEGVDSLGYIPINSTDFLDYTIRFQNTGNDTAHTVVITDQLDTNLKWQNIEFISSSHSVQINGEQNGIITFTFNNIMLLDSNVNEIGSHGFIKYRAFLDLDDSLDLYTTVNNMAHIYFDYNPAIVTNTAITTLYNCDSVFANLSLTTGVCGIIASNANGLSNTWTVFDTTVVNTDYLSLFVDTIGSFNLQLISNNNLCPYDTTITFAIDPQQEITTNDVFYICPTDSISIFNSFENQEGTYIETFQNILGCDSTSTVVLNHYPQFITVDTLDFCVGDSVFIFDQFISSTGTYVDTLQTLNGCDSIFIVHLRNYPNFINTQIDTITICFGDSVSIYNVYQNTQGLYTSTLQNTYGCDSIITTYLAVNPIDYISNDTSIIEGDSVYFSGEYIYFNGIYYDTLTNSFGCDSIIEFSLNLINSGIDTQIACDSFTWINGITYYTSNNTATHILSNVYGNDSTVTLDLTLNYSTYGDTSAVSCESFEWYGVTYTTSTVTNHILTNSLGCDSIITLDLTINYSSHGDTTVVTCEPFEWYGINYSASTIADHLITNSNGCDSTVTLHLTVNTIDTTLTTTVTSITSNSNGSTYQWLDCNLDYSIIIGETNQEYTPDINGVYAVELTNNNCVDTSSCVVISSLDIEDSKFNSNPVFVYPNPTYSYIEVEFGNLTNVTLKIIDARGKLLFSCLNINSSPYKLNLELESGLYFVEIISGDYHKKLKFIQN